MGKKIYRLTVEPLTCIHIGTGNKLTLLDYTVGIAESGENMYMKFSSDSILARIAAEPAKAKEFEMASSSANMKKLQEFFQNNFSKNDDLEYICECTQEFFQLYTQNKDPYENAAIVEQMYRQSGDGKPVIPGSSIKGAVRTAVLNKLVSKLPMKKYDELCDKLDDRKQDQKEKLNSEFQKELLGNYRDAKSDPFRAIEFSDCEFPAENTQIVGLLKNIFRQDTEQIVINSIQIQAEVLKGAFMGNEKTGESYLRLNTDLMEKNGVKRTFGVEDIIESCNGFFLYEFKKEYEKFYGSDVESDDLYNELKSCKKNQFILRLGHWSQIEFVTFEKNLRSPKTRKVKGKTLPSGTTRTLFNYDDNYFPLGWCKISVEEVK